jgi:predicted CopG family antitoxin
LEIQQLKSEKEAQADLISRLQKENRTILDDGKAKGDACQEELDLLKKEIDELRKENIDLTNEK